MTGTTEPATTGKSARHKQPALRWLRHGARKRLQFHREAWIILLTLVFLTASALLGLGLNHFDSVGVASSLVARSIDFRATAGQPLDLYTDVTFAPPYGHPKGAVRLRIENVLTSDPPLSGIGNDFILEADSLRLTGVTLAGSGIFGLMLSRGTDHLRLIAGGGTFTLTALATPTNPISVLNQAGQTMLFPGFTGVVAITVRSNPIGQAPLLIDGQVSFTSNSGATSDALPPLTIEDALVQTVRFGRENSVIDRTPFVSSIESGTVTLAATGEKLTLERGSPLSLPGFDGALVGLELQHDGAHVTLTGSTKRVSLGPAGFAHDVTPTILDVLYHVPSVRLTCGTVFSVVVALASLLFIREEGKL